MTQTALGPPLDPYDGWKGSWPKKCRGRGLLGSQVVYGVLIYSQAIIPEKRIPEVK